jgi:hypothetical protein
MVPVQMDHQRDHEEQWYKNLLLTVSSGNLGSRLPVYFCVLKVHLKIFEIFLFFSLF